MCAQDLLEKMRNCRQNKNQSILEHGESVQEHLKQLIQFIKGETQALPNWRLPSWVHEYREQISSKLLPESDIYEYALYHDCGKPFCITTDSDGKPHFPDHAVASKRLWLEYGGSESIGELIGMDMDIHLLKADRIDEFAGRPQAITLLLAGLAEVHANCTMFGGIESTSFKIKWKHIDRRGSAICKKLSE